MSQCLSVKAGQVHIGAVRYRGRLCTDAVTLPAGAGIRLICEERPASNRTLCPAKPSGGRGPSRVHCTDGVAACSQGWLPFFRAPTYLSPGKDPVTEDRDIAPR